MHIPVLLQHVIVVLDIQPDDVVLDCTAGGGGHAEAILALLGPHGRYLGIDADEQALARVRARLGTDERVHLMHGNFRELDALLAKSDVVAVNKVLFDLGLSSDQLTGDTARGFSFQRDEPLTMTFAASPPEGALTAYHVVNEWSEETLADIIYGFGGERRARKIARAIIEAREVEPITTSGQLSELIARTLHRRGATHPATSTFQAIRMAVNDELGALEAGLKKAYTALAPGGLIAVISFHSLEDRLVKHTFRAWERDAKGTVHTKKPLVPSRAEIRENPRARSSKLRVFEKAILQ